MVLFLFVIMLVNDQGYRRPEQVFLSGIAPLAVLGGVLLGVLIAFGILFGVDGRRRRRRDRPCGWSTVRTVGNTEAVGGVLYTKYLVPFEIVSVVLLVAMIGAIVFGRRDVGPCRSGGGGGAMIDATHYVALSLILFCLGLVGVMMRRNFITVLMSLELMFNAVNLNLIAFSFRLGGSRGPGAGDLRHHDRRRRGGHRTRTDHRPGPAQGHGGPRRGRRDAGLTA